MIIIKTEVKQNSHLFINKTEKNRNRFPAINYINNLNKMAINMYCAFERQAFLNCMKKVEWEDDLYFVIKKDGIGFNEIKGFVYIGLESNWEGFSLKVVCDLSCNNSYYIVSNDKSGKEYMYDEYDEVMDEKFLEEEEEFVGKDEEEFGIINPSDTCCENCLTQIKKGTRIYAGGEYETECLCKICWERPQCNCFNSCYFDDDGKCPNCDAQDIKIYVLSDGETWGMEGENRKATIYDVEMWGEEYNIELGDWIGVVNGEEFLTGKSVSVLYISKNELNEIEKGTEYGSPVRHLDDYYERLICEDDDDDEETEEVTAAIDLLNKIKKEDEKNYRIFH